MGSLMLATVFYTLWLLQAVFFPPYLVEGRTIARNDGRIVGGRDALPGEFPYQASIGYIDPETKAYLHMCGASILDRHHVLTSAFCGKLFEKGEWTVMAGALNVTDRTEKSRVELPTAQVYVNEGFTYQFLQNDTALIRVNGELPLDGKAISSIPVRNVTLNPPAQCTVSGWGQRQSNPAVYTSDVLQGLDEPLIPQEDCVKTYEDAPLHVLPGMLCSGFLGGGPSACENDKGGPLVCGGQLTGIVTLTVTCTTGIYPTVYTDVAYYKDWIQETLSQSIKDGGL